MRLCWTLFTALGLLAGCQCSDGGIELFVELDTDLVPGVEFHEARTEVFVGDSRNTFFNERTMISLSDDVSSLRLAEVSGLTPGALVVRVTLLDAAGGEVMGRSIRVQASANTSLPVRITRDCVGLVCAVSDDIGSGELTQCLAGRCVQERCSQSTPEFCLRSECSTSTDCTDVTSACAERSCEGGVCFVRRDDAMCAHGQYCDPTLGCSSAPTLDDGGVELPAWSQESYLKASNTGANDALGFSSSLSADGNILALGAPAEESAATGPGGDAADDSAPGAGAVYIFTREGGNWVQAAYLKASNTGIGDGFGRSLSLSADGSTLAVGAPAEASAARGVDGDEGDNSATESGAVYVFSQSSGVWAQSAYLKASNTDILDSFGTSISLNANGTTLAVGARSEGSRATGVGGDQSDDGARSAGAVYVFSRNLEGWAQQAYLKASNTEAGDLWGDSLSLNALGDLLAIGAPLEDSSATGVDGDQSDNGAVDAGAVYIFARSGGLWGQRAYLKASNTDAGDLFGAALSMSADGAFVAVGAIGEGGAGTGANGDQGSNAASSAGAVYAFRATGDTWSQEVYLKASNPDAGDLFGASLSLSADGSLLAVGSRNEDSGGRGLGTGPLDESADSAGAAYVFSRSGRSWFQQVFLKASNTDAGDHFGRSLSLNASGDTLCIGADAEDSAGIGSGSAQDDNSAEDSGAAFLFESPGQ